MGLLYQKRRLQVNKVKRKIGAIRTQIQRFRRLLSLILIIIFCYLAYLILKLPQWYISAADLKTANKQVFIINGNNITPEYKIYDIIRQTNLPYTQIFRLKTKDLENNLKQMHSIKDVYIRRQWFPAKMIISLQERNIAFLLAPNLETAPTSALTTDGVLLDHDYFPLKSSIKAKKLLTYGVRNGVDEVWDKEKVDTLLKLVQDIEAYSSQEVQYIDIRNEKDIYVMIKEYLIRLGEINTNSLNRAKLIASILPEARKIQNSKQKIKYIDLRWEDSYYLRLEGVKEVVKPTPVKANQNENSEVKKPEDTPQQVQQIDSQQENVSQEELD